MSNDVFTSGDRGAIRREIRRQFLKGGGAGIAAFAGVGLFVYAMVLISWLLPPESKEAVDPTPDSFPRLAASEDTDG